MFLTVRVCDAAGTLVPRAALPVTFSVSGPAEVIAVDNGDSTSFEPFQASRRTTFNGLALALIFGIFVSTVLTLVVIPVLYFAAFGGKKGLGTSG